MPFHLTGGFIDSFIHALLAGLVAVRYLWPVWLLIAALWLITRGMRAVGRFFGFSGGTAKPTKRAVPPRR